MRRIVLWVLSTLSTLVLLFGYHTSTSGPLATSATTVIESPVTSATPSGSATASGSATTSGSSRRTTPTTSTVTGHTVATQWGPVQVQLNLEGGRITQVSVLQYPNGNGRDAEINSYALPILVQETIDAQSASIDMVSGATVTSVGYLQSLQSALDQEGA